MQEVPSELEQHIGNARRAVTASYLGVQERVQGVVSRWIGVEQRVESACKPLKLLFFPYTYVVNFTQDESSL